MDETFLGIQNRELSNHEAFCSELAGKGHTVRTRCDTEILPRLFADAGEQCRRGCRQRSRSASGLRGAERR